MQRMGRWCLPCALAGIATAGLSAASRADYVFHDLYSLTGGDANASIALPQSAVGGRVIGQDNNAMHSLIWEGPGAPTPLADSAYADSFPSGIGGSQVVGAGSPDAQSAATHALLWAGPSHTLVDLNPAGALGSVAWATNGDEQVGSAQVLGGSSHAILWHGTAASFVDLTAPDFYDCVARATDGTQQVGSGWAIFLGGGRRAMLWSGTAASFVDLDPAGRGSEAVGVSRNEQVGNVSISPGVFHATLWHGTAVSMADLQPGFAGADNSFALATNGSQEVGFLQQPGNPFSGRAVVWVGSAASAVDLQALLPAGFTESWAESIDADGNVFGIALNDPEGAFHAVEWSPAPEPSSIGLAALGLSLFLRRART